MDLNETAVFVRVVQAGSFSAAARQLGLPTSTVSTRVARLERRLGVTLLQRTTRRLHLTASGQSGCSGNGKTDVLRAQLKGMAIRLQCRLVLIVANQQFAVVEHQIGIIRCGRTKTSGQRQR